MSVQNKPEGKEPALSRYTYLNPEFMPDHVNEEFCRTHRASGLAYDLHAIIATAHAATENDNMGVPIDRRGIDKTLAIAVNIAGDLIDQCERLEGELIRATEKADE
ncbi:MAG: hypothetical protein AAFQ79_02450 [Pseudomonadota bacterium]